MNELIVQNWKVIVDKENLTGAWITAEELGRHLGYKEPRLSVMRIFNRHKDRFQNEIHFTVVKLTTEAGFRNATVFSERGALKITRFSDKDKADEIMDKIIEVFLAIKNQPEQLRKDFLDEMKYRYWITDGPGEKQKTFPDYIAIDFGKLYRLPFAKSNTAHPCLSGLYAKYIYEAAPDGIYEKLRIKNYGGRGGRKYKHHQFLTDDAKDWLKKHIAIVSGLIRGSGYDLDRFKAMFNLAFPDCRFCAILEEKEEELKKIMQMNFDF